MLNVFVRTILIFSMLFVLIRLMGKRQIGEMQPFELVVTLVIADLACIPMQDVSIPLFYGIIPILAIFLLHKVILEVGKKNITLRKMLSGKPTIVINKEGVNETNLKNINMTINDLMEGVRGAGYFHLDTIDYGIFETNGKMSVISTSNESLSTLPLVLIGDGKMFKKTVVNIGAYDVICEILREQNAEIKDIFVLTLDNAGKVYFQKYNESYKVFNVNYTGDGKW